ncbi:MAG: FadR/GntR family transcriptional regulator [Bacillota bacterium]
MIDEVIVKILTHIDEKGLCAGSKLPPERDLARELSVNRTSLREALAVLEYMRYIRRVRGSGIYLLDLDQGSFEGNLYKLFREDGITYDRAFEIYEAVIMVESVIGQLAASKSTPEGVGDLRENIESMKRLLAGGGNTYKLDVDFHRCIAKMSRNIFLLQISTSFWLRLSGYARLVQSYPAQAGDLLAHHIQIADAIEAGDVSGTDRLIKMHYRYSMDFIVNHLQGDGIKD